jgi:hypothetical protein
VTAGRRRGGWSRRGRRGRFTYFDEVRREHVTEESALERVRELAIPPAWSDVWISPSAGARLQATGFDAAGPQAVPLSSRPPGCSRAWEVRPARRFRRGPTVAAPVDRGGRDKGARSRSNGRLRSR